MENTMKTSSQSAEIFINLERSVRGRTLASINWLRTIGVISDMFSICLGWGSALLLRQLAILTCCIWLVWGEGREWCFDKIKWINNSLQPRMLEERRGRIGSKLPSCMDIIEIHLDGRYTLLVSLTTISKSVIPHNSGIYPVDIDIDIDIEGDGSTPSAHMFSSFKPYINYDFSNFWISTQNFLCCQNVFALCTTCINSP